MSGWGVLMVGAAFNMLSCCQWSREKFSHCFIF